MYNFVDTIEGNSGSVNLPSEALQINGVFIENVIEGYRTLYTSGRELLAPEINALELNKRHGQIYRSRRYPARTITVGFQLIAPSAEEFRERFNILNGILYAEQAQLIFADEPDKCFYGTLSAGESPEPGRNAIVGEFSFTCSDPFKYSVEEISVEVGASSTIAYGGTVEAWPVLEADFPKYGSSGVCSYLLFKDGDGDAIQIGSLNTGDFITDDSSSKNLIYEFFYSNIDSMIYCADDIYCSDSLPCCLSTQWTANNCAFVTGDYTLTTGGSVAVTESGSNGRLAAASYGSGEYFHGPAVSTTVEETVDFELAFQNYFTSSSIEEKGMFIATLNNVGDAETVIASIVLAKDEDQQTVEVLLVVNADVRKQLTLSLPLSDVSTRIAKEGNKVEFTVNGLTYTFYDDSIETVGIHKAGFLLGSYGSDTPLTTNELEWVRLTNDPGKFTANDAVIADCRSATIKMNDISRPALDMVSNDWESFTLKPGSNVITTAYKTTGTKIPTFVVKYREVYL